TPRATWSAGPASSGWVRLGLPLGPRLVQMAQEVVQDRLGLFNEGRVAGVLDDDLLVLPSVLAVALQDRAGLGDHGLGRAGIGTRPSGHGPALAEVGQVEERGVADALVAVATDPEDRGLGGDVGEGGYV